MSLFVAGLAFEDDTLLSISKIAILGASVASGICGSLISGEPERESDRGVTAS